jgi:NADH dehydrogenase
VVGDVALTPDEVAGLTANLLVSRGLPTGQTRFTEWLREHAGELGRTWANELARHFR